MHVRVYVLKNDELGIPAYKYRLKCEATPSRSVLNRPLVTGVVVSFPNAALCCLEHAFPMGKGGTGQAPSKYFSGVTIISLSSNRRVKWHILGS